MDEDARGAKNCELSARKSVERSPAAVSPRRQEQVSNPDRFHKKPQSNRRSIFKKQRRTDECIWLRQEILEPANEDSARHRRCERISVPAVAAKNKKIALNPASGQTLSTTQLQSQELGYRART